MKERKQGITVVVNAHKEGELLWRSLMSAERALSVFKSEHQKRGAEIVVVLDATDTRTKKVVERFILRCAPISIRFVESFCADLGQARNTGVRHGAFDHTAFLDADDIFGERWLTEAWEYLHKLDFPAVAHTQVNVNFERDMLYWQHVDSRDPTFDPSVFCVTNHWTALSMAKTELYEAHPYAPVARERGTGFEDWEWNTRTLSAGIAHVVVPKTVHFIRKRSGSMSDAHAGQNRATECNKFWDVPWLNKHPPVASPKDVDGWLVKQWKAAHEVERELWPHPQELAGRPLYVPPGSPAEWKLYHLLRTAIPKDTTHLILIAGYGGGADLRASCYADAVEAAGGKPILVATDARRGPITGNRGIRSVIEAWSQLSKLARHEQARVVQRLMRQCREAEMVVHVVNSAVAWGALGQSPALFDREGLPPVFASLYARQLQPDGSSGGYAFNGAFSTAMPAVTEVITDNEPFSKELHDSLGWSHTTVAKTPWPRARQRRRTNDYGMRALWCGRIDWNKNLGFALDVAIELKKSIGDFELHIWGLPADWWGARDFDRAKALPWCKLHGAYGSFDEVQGFYDVGLFTSRHEGSPNVVQEMLAAGIPVVTTNVGDVGEYAQYVPPPEATALEWAEIAVIAANGFQPIPAQPGRSETAFSDALRSAGYFSNLATKTEAA